MDGLWIDRKEVQVLFKFGICEQLKLEFFSGIALIYRRFIAISVLRGCRAHIVSCSVVFEGQR